MPMNRNFTFNYLINSYKSGVTEVQQYNYSPAGACEDSILKINHPEFEPSQRCIDAILSFACQYEVIQSDYAGDVELNLN